jgi:hypothetical protein
MCQLRVFAVQAEIEQRIPNRRSAEPPRLPLVAPLAVTRSGRTVEEETDSV